MKIKASFFVIIFLLLFINSTFCQITFQRTYGGIGDDVFYSVQQTFDGGYIMAGYTNSFGAGGYDVYLVKTDSIGDTLWTRTYGGTGDDIGYCVQQTTDSGYIIIGYTQSFGHGNDDIYLLKTNAIGDTLWTKLYRGPYSDVGKFVNQTIDGGYIIYGTTEVFGTQTDEVFLIKTDISGDTLWTKTYGIHIGNFGGSIEQTADSGYIITGTGDYNGDIYLIKIDVNGNLTWKKTYGGSYLDFGSSVKQTLDGGYIVVGYQDSLGPGVYLIKTNSFGDTLWTKAYGGDSSEAGWSIHLTNDSDFIITGATKSFGAGDYDVYLIKINAASDTIWTKTFGGGHRDASYSVQQTSNGGYILTGYTNSFGAGGYDGYLIKTDSNGNSGCYENGTATIVSTPSTIISIPNDSIPLPQHAMVSSPATITGSGSLMNTLCLTSGLNETNVEVNSILYPNPASDNFTIKINTEFKNIKVEILDVFGDKIYSEKLFSDQIVINCKEYLDGIYFILLSIENHIVIKKIIINK